MVGRRESELLDDLPTAISDVLDRLVAADDSRGIERKFVYFDDAKSMKPFGGNPVTTVKRASQYKAQLDAIFRKGNLEYLMLLGALRCSAISPGVNLVQPGDPLES